MINVDFNKATLVMQSVTITYIKGWKDEAERFVNSIFRLQLRLFGYLLLMC